MAAKPGFLKTAIKDFKTIGAIAGSSPHLIEEMLEPVPFSSARSIVEMGAGDGRITDAIIRHMSPESQLLVFELNDVFFAGLARIQDARVQCLNQNAADLLQWVQPDSVDAVISALPLAFIPKAEKNRILRAAAESLKPGGLFVQFQYSLTDYGLLRRHFGKVGVRFELLNIPPAFIYVCTK